MRFFHSLRTRLTLWYALWLGATLLVTGLTAYVLTRAALMENLDRSLRSEVAWVNDFIEPKAKRVRLKRAAIRELRELRRSAAVPPADPADSLSTDDEVDDMWAEIYQHMLLSPRRHYVQILDRNGDLLYRSQNLDRQRLEHADMPYKWIQVFTSRTMEGDEIRIAVTQNDYVKIYLAYPLQPVNELLDGLFFSFRVFAPLAFLISIVGGWFLASKSLQPVDSITRAAREITAQNLSRRLPDRRADDELGRLTAQFNDMIGRLQTSFAQVQQFSADASHELRTPLTIMRGEIEVALRRRDTSARTRELLTSLHDEVVRLSSIVESLMTLVNSDMGRLSLQVATFDLRGLVEEIADNARLLAKPARLTVTVAAGEPVIVVGDRLRLRQLLLNLADNAVKYSRPGGKVSFRLDRSQDGAFVSVSDSGIGVPEQERERIFERFYRIPRAGDATTGSGLGLPIARWIAEAHGGSLTVQDHAGPGTTFVVRLPLPEAGSRR